MKKKMKGLGFFVLLIIGLVAFLPFNTIAQESTYTKTVAKWKTITNSKVVITGIHENYLIIGQGKYYFFRDTVFIRKSNNGEKRISGDDLVFPARVKITYRVYSSSDENHPFYKNQKVLSKVYWY